MYIFFCCQRCKTLSVKLTDAESTCSEKNITGFSSFFYLRELPVDAVKIDGSFIKNLADNSDDVILVNALCSVARGFGKKVTAEFVESEKILEIIEQMDIDYAQGYYIGRPSPIEQFLAERNLPSK